MKTIVVDQFEFANWSSEEALEISFARRTDFPDLQRFAASTVGIDIARSLPAAISFNGYCGEGLIREYLKRHAAIELPQSCDCLVHVLSDEPGDFDAILVSSELYIRYHWSSSA